MPRAKADTAPHLRTRRWDVVVLGSALPGLVAAVRLVQAGLRVIVIEEQAASALQERLRDPFFLPAGSVLQHCLGALGVRTMDPRVLRQSELAYQVLLAKARLDVGTPERSAEELTNWKFALPQPAHEIFAALFEAGQREAAALLENEWLQSDVSPAPIKRRSARREARALPAALHQAEGDFARYLEAQWRVLARGAGEVPAPRALARLLGGALGGGVQLTPESDSLRGIVRQRFLARSGEVRAHAGTFEFAELGDARGVVLRGAREEVCVGRVLLLNASDERLLAASEAWGFDAPDFVSRARRVPPLRRVAMRLRVTRRSLPKPLAARAIWWPEHGELPNPLEILRYPPVRSAVFEDLLLASTFPNAGAKRADQIARMVNAAGSLLDLRLAAPEEPPPARPLWDDDALQFNPRPKQGWPNPVDLRTAGGRGRVFRLAPDVVFGLGVEGELLLGLRAGAALRAKLR